jgi:hypothetical protein
VLVAVLCLALPAFALGQQGPSPQPLWQAYPLDSGSPDAAPKASSKPKPSAPSEQPAAPSGASVQSTAPSGASVQSTAPSGASEQPTAPSKQSTAPSGASEQSTAPPEQSTAPSGASDQSTAPGNQSPAPSGASDQATVAGGAAPPSTRYVAGEPRAKAAPFAVTILFFGAMAAIALLGVAWFMRRGWRGLEAAADPPRSNGAAPRDRPPPTCEITWSPGQAGAAFLATVEQPGAGPDLIAESPSFGPPGGGPPPETPATRVAHEQLVRTLEGDGWRPVGRGGDWYSVRFRRSPTSTSTKEGKND